MPGDGPRYSARIKSDQVGRAGEYLVAAEVLRRGGYAVTFSGNMPFIDVLASDQDHARRAVIQVKTKGIRSGTWQTTNEQKQRREHLTDFSERFWVLVSLTSDGADYYVVPEEWMLNDIDHRYGKYLRQHGGARPRTAGSRHYAIKPGHVEEWRERWDMLGIFDL